MSAARWRALVLWSCGVVVLIWAGVSCFRLLHFYLIAIEPFPRRVTLDGREQQLNKNGTFTLYELGGEHIIKVWFAEKATVTVAVFPRLSDDESSALFITQEKVVSEGDLRYKVLK